jgi:hypothetical protein
LCRLSFTATNPHTHLDLVPEGFQVAWSQAFSHDLVLACPGDPQADRDLVELQQVCPLVDRHVPSVAVKLAKPAQRLRLALPPGWSSFRAEAGRRVRRACLGLAQMVKAKRVLERSPETSSRLVVLRQVCLDPARKVKVKLPLVIRRAASVLLLVACDRVCLLERVKLAAPHQRPEPLGSRHLLAAESLLRERQRQLAEECSWDFQS